MKQLLLGLCKKYSFFSLRLLLNWSFTKVNSQFISFTSLKNKSFLFRDSVLSHSLFLLFALLFSSNVLHAENLSFYDNTTWNVIRERLFNGDNTKAYRFEEDIRFQVIGAKTHQDSAVFIQLINELNGLMETVQITMVDKSGNFKLYLDEEGYGNSFSQVPSGTSLKKVYIRLSFPKGIMEKESINRIYFNVVRNLTTLYPNTKERKTHYGGIFDATSDFRESETNFHIVDKDIIRQLYSHDFYKKLKKWTVSEYDYESYLNLRYKKLITKFSITIKVILVLFAFLYLLSKESKRKQNPNLRLYIQQRAIIPIILPFFFSISNTSGNHLLLIVTDPIAFILNYIGILLIAILILIITYYVETFYLKKVSNIGLKQVLIFTSTFVTINTLSIAVLFLFRRLFFFISPEIDNNNLVVQFWNPDFSWQSLIISIVTLRVFYNIITYRIKSMVNQKDVEIAKMKELKNQAELNALHSRINPHFLYNSLNSIASLAHIDADKTETMATGLSELFRYSINKENKTYVTVAEELEMVTKYLEIEKTRFGKRLAYEINTDESTLNKQIPKFLIQPLVENAIKHGLSKIKETGKIVVEIKQVDKALTIAIFDNGPDFPAEPVSGYGMQNLNDKLDIIYGEKASINWENNPHKHVKITLKNQF